MRDNAHGTFIAESVYQINRNNSWRGLYPWSDQDEGLFSVLSFFFIMPHVLSSPSYGLFGTGDEGAGGGRGGLPMSSSSLRSNP